MQDPFVGDIGDYGKYGLLRVLNHEDGFRLGIAWMKTIAGHRSKPPSRVTIDYLDTSKRTNESLAVCDPGLYQILKSVVDNGKRTIADLEASHALPADTIYFDKLLDFGDMPANGKEAVG